MIQKLCPNCLQNSYSSYDNPEWICPYCGKNIPRSLPDENSLTLVNVKGGTVQCDLGKEVNN